MNMEPKKDYEVGYGKPPKAHQWKPGQSGNPKGKPKKPPSMKALAEEIADALYETGSIKVNGKIETVTVLKAFARAISREAVTARFKEKIEFVELLEWLGISALAEAKLLDAQSEKEAQEREFERRLILLCDRHDKQEN